MKTYILGLTGPTGSGKGVAAEILKEKGFLVVDADAVYHQLLKKGKSCCEAVRLLFGDEVLNESGAVDTKKLRGVIGRDKMRMELLNNTVHPIIVDNIAARIRRAARKGQKLFVIDGPLLFESGGNRTCNAVMCVLADKKVRIERIMQRDNLTEEQAQTRVSFQQTDDYYLKRSNFAVYNNGDKTSLKKQIDDLGAFWLPGGKE